MPTGTSTAGGYNLIGGFAIAQQNGFQALIITTALVLPDSTRPETNAVQQVYLQFKDWNKKSEASVSQYMNLGCYTFVPATTEVYTTATKDGSCGPEVLAAQKIGPYTEIRGSTSINTIDCNIQNAIYNLDQGAVTKW